MAKLLHLIAACDRHRVIGHAGRLPWTIPADTAHFHQATAGQICVLGRICFETWPRAVLDGRRPIVITRQRQLARTGVAVAGSLAEALAQAESLPGAIYICGGQRIFEETLALAPVRSLRLQLTLVDADVPGDTYFPEWRHLPWREVERREGFDAGYRLTFLTLEGPVPSPAGAPPLPRPGA